MKNYEQYRVEDFVQDEEFRDWVQGQSRQEAFWISFIQKYPQQKEAMQQAEQMIRAAHLSEESLSEKEIRSEVEKFLTRATRLNVVPSSPPLTFPKPLWKRFLTSRAGVLAALSAAAVLVFVLGLLWYDVPAATNPQISPTRHDQAFSRLIETNNPTAQPLRIILSDSTEVVLSPRSSLRYPSEFPDSARQVYLNGEASFTVTHRGQPFTVQTGEMITRVLGTKFVVSAFDTDKRITVQVLSGKVSVYRAQTSQEAGNKEVKGLILTANQAAIFEKEMRHLTKSLVANPVAINQIATDTEFRYDEIPLPAILHELEQYYGITIQFDEQSLRSCRITATLGNESLYEKLDVLCKTITASYEIVDGQIVINGKGCQE